MESKCPNDPVRCVNCSDHFRRLRDSVKEVRATKRFLRDAPGFDERALLSCEHRHFKRLHRYEGRAGEGHLFRAIQKHVHILYAIEGGRLILLRAFRKYSDYSRYLQDKKAISRDLGQAASGKGNFNL